MLLKYVGKQLLVIENSILGQHIDQLMTQPILSLIYIHVLS